MLLPKVHHFLRFGFVRNSAIVKTLHSDDDSSFFIHSSGGMFVCLPNYYANYYTSRSRHTSANSTCSVTKASVSQSGKSVLNTAVISNEMHTRIVGTGGNTEFDTLGVYETKNSDSNEMELDPKVTRIIFKGCNQIYFPLVLIFNLF